jgi:hypothetical protein
MLNRGGIAEGERDGLAMTEHVREKLVAANDIDAALEESLTTVWDAKVYSWDNSKYPFNEWMLNRSTISAICTKPFRSTRRTRSPSSSAPIPTCLSFAGC